jgi:deuterolysin
VALENLNSTSFDVLKRKDHIEVSINLADLYDVSEGGTFEVSGDNKIPWSWIKSTKLEGESIYTTNTLTITIPKAPPKPKQNTVLMSDCFAEKYQETRKAEAVCSMLSIVAGTSALHGDSEQYVMKKNLPSLLN